MEEVHSHKKTKKDKPSVKKGGSMIIRRSPTADQPIHEKPRAKYNEEVEPTSEKEEHEQPEEEEKQVKPKKKEKKKGKRKEKTKQNEQGGSNDKEADREKENENKVAKEKESETDEKEKESETERESEVSEDEKGEERKKKSVLVVPTSKRFATWGKKSKPTSSDKAEKGGSLRLGKEANGLKKTGWLRMRTKTNTKSDTEGNTEVEKKNTTTTATTATPPIPTSATAPALLSSQRPSPQPISLPKAEMVTRDDSACKSPLSPTKRKWRATIGPLALAEQQHQQQQLQQQQQQQHQQQQLQLQQGEDAKLRSSSLPVRKGSGSNSSSGSGSGISSRKSERKAAQQQQHTRSGMEDDGSMLLSDEHSWGIDAEEDESGLMTNSAWDAMPSSSSKIKTNSSREGKEEKADTDSVKKKKKKKMKMKRKRADSEASHPSAEDILRKYYPNIIISPDTTDEPAVPTQHHKPSTGKEKEKEKEKEEKEKQKEKEKEKEKEKGETRDAKEKHEEGGSNYTKAVTVGRGGKEEPYVTKLKRYIQEGINFIATNLTTWAVTVSVPSTNAKSEIANITRYIHCIFEMWDSFPETQTEQGFSMVDVMKLKPENQQSMVRLSVNLLIKRLMAIQDHVTKITSIALLIKMYQIIYGTKEFVETGERPKDLMDVRMPVKTTFSLAGLEKKLAENNLGTDFLTLPGNSNLPISLLSPRGVEHQHIAEETPYMEGALFIRAANSNSWKQKHFVLFKRKLVEHPKTYQEDKMKGDKEKKPQRVWDLRSIKTVEVVTPLGSSGTQKTGRVGVAASAPASLSSGTNTINTTKTGLSNSHHPHHHHSGGKGGSSSSSPSEFVFRLRFLEEDDDLEFKANSKQEMGEWVLAIDGLCMRNFGSHMDNTAKRELLHAMYKESVRGGFVKSSYDEEWSYAPNGELVCLTGACNKSGQQQQQQQQTGKKKQQQQVVYLWDGETLQPKEGSPSFGFGRWNGVWLAWYKPTSVPTPRDDSDVEQQEEAHNTTTTTTTTPTTPTTPTTKRRQEEPLLRYFWVPTEREFHTTNLQLTWKWTRHFLASKYGTGEWILEGEVPNPVVMALQLMRYCSLLEN